MWLSFGKADLDAELRKINHRIGILMATFAEALAGWTNYAGELKAQNDDLRTQLEAANATLADWRNIDAAEDAEQAAALEQQLADQLAAALEAVKNPPVEPEVPVEPEAPAEPE